MFSTEHDPGGIQVGTCISTFLKRAGTKSAPGKTPIQYREFWGRADQKRRALAESLYMDAWSTTKKAEAAKRPPRL